MNVGAVAIGATVRHGFHDPAYPSHLGADLAVDVGTPVLAPLAGRVTFAGADDASGDGGLGVKVDVGGASVGVWHLSRVAVAAGQAVGAGALLGYSGQTGNAVYPHVHLQIEQPPGTPVDPVAFLAAIAATSAAGAPGAPSAPAGGTNWRPLLAVGALVLVALTILDD